MPELAQLDGHFVYRPDGATLREFLHDRSEVCGIVGPVGSGTSSAMCFRIYGTAMQQAPSPRDGKRRTRWAVVRPTYPELMTSTVKTWLFWFPEETYGKLVRSRPMNQTIALGDMELEVWFLALDGPDDIGKIRSTEWTGFAMNELEFHTIEIFDEARSRAGRYPAMADGGPSWYGVIFDMNAPPEDHFIARMAGWSDWPDDVPEEKRRRLPANWRLLRQPPGLLEIKDAAGRVTGYVDNPDAENVKWLPEGYYRNLAAGWPKTLIDSRIMNRVSIIAAGDPVWPNFDEEVHIAKTPLKWVPDREIIVSEDFGRRPCAILSQEIGSKIHIFKEFRMYGVGATIFAPALKRFIEQNYRGARIRFTGDPKGHDRSQSGEQSAIEIHAGYGMQIVPARGRTAQVNDVKERIEAVSYALMTNRILVDPQGCPTLAAALRGKYVLDKLDGVEPEPMKRGEAAKYSDVADCLQYLCLFLGEGRRMVGVEVSRAATKPVAAFQRRSLRRVGA